MFTINTNVGSKILIKIVTHDKPSITGYDIAFIYCKNVSNIWINVICILWKYNKTKLNLTINFYMFLKLKFSRISSKSQKFANFFVGKIHKTFNVLSTKVWCNA